MSKKKNSKRLRELVNPYEMGSIQWQLYMNNTIFMKALKGETLNEDEESFIDIQIPHNFKMIEKNNNIFKKENEHILGSFKEDK